MAYSLMYLLIAFPFMLVKLLSSPNDFKNTFYIISILFTHFFILILWYAISKIEIQLYDQSIAYKTAFHTRELNWKDIFVVDLHFAFNVQHADAKWIFTAAKKSISISPFYFSESDNLLLAEAIITKCSSARVSTSIKKIVERKFPWYIF